MIVLDDDVVFLADDFLWVARLRKMPGIPERRVDIGMCQLQHMPEDALCAAVKRSSLETALRELGYVQIIPNMWKEYKGYV